MNHILKRISIAGAKKADKPKPPIYKPPVMGELQYGASFSYSEVLDLVSDGPIEGVCNNFGVVQRGRGILQGIYLDDTPVAVSVDNAPRVAEDLPEQQVQTLEIKPATLTVGNESGAKCMRKYFQAINQQRYRSRDGLITDLKKNGNRGPIQQGEYPYLPHVSMFMLRWRKSSNKCRDKDPKDKQHYAIYIRAYIKYYGSSDKRFYWYLNGNQRTDQGSSQNNAVYRNGNKSRDRLTHLYWTNQRGLSNSSFFFGFGHRSGGGYFDKQLFKKSSDASELLVRPQIQKIMQLWNDNGPSNPEGNRFQRDLAAQALSDLNWNGSQMNPGTGAAGNGLLHNWLEKSNRRKAHAVILLDEVNPDLVGKTVLEDGEVAPMRTYPYGGNHGWSLENKMRGAGLRTASVTCPEVDSNGIMTGKMFGFLVFQLTTSWKRIKNLRCSGLSRGEAFRSYTVCIMKKEKDVLKDISSLKYSKVIPDDIPQEVNEFEIVDQKYNFSNVLAEVRTGEEDQQPFKFFKQVFIDHVYNQELFGPFSSKSRIYPQRINDNRDMLTKSKVLSKGASNYNIDVDSKGLPINEGSDDERLDSRSNIRDYSSWGKNSLIRWDERALPVTHTVYNPNVTKCFLTLQINQLGDTLVRDVDNVRAEGDEDLKIGTKFPTVVNIQVEVGRFLKDFNGGGTRGGQVVTDTYTYRIVALVESTTLIDIGNPDYKSEGSGSEYVLSLHSTDPRAGRLSMPFTLPKARIFNNDVLTEDGERGIEAGTIDEDSVEERFVRITKLSYETNSVLLAKEVLVNKVTEIIECDLPYPFSAIIGTKLDSRAFSAIPTRSFDCKLKKVRVPSNYNPTVNDIDKRYWDRVGKQSEGTNNAQKGSFYWTKAAIEEGRSDVDPEALLVYEGDWDGSFKEELEWTDNPAWILYDLLVSQRYGMGTHIDVDSINKWQLYKIGRFCDAVDENGYFEGVTDGRGGREPRFSCNIVFDQGQKIYDAINTIAGIFRGRAFFGNSEINFVDDRPRRPVNLFTNESVKDGLFFYSNNRRDEQFNTIEVGYRDRFDNFSPKVEVIEDEENIRERGVFKKKIEGVGITSRAMARRVGQHQIFSSIKENQTVAFTAGLESLLCQPGDLIVVEDELKTNRSNFGKILDVNIDKQEIRMSNTFVADDMTAKVTLYHPTGVDTIDDIDILGSAKRQRYQSFTITGNPDTAPWAGFTGYYSFSGYLKGYPDIVDEDDNRYEQYAAYTGLTTGINSVERITTLYYETGVSGWMFGSGEAVKLKSGSFISELTGDQSLNAMGTGFLLPVDMTEADKRDSSASLSPFSGFAVAGDDDRNRDSFIGPYRGAMDSEISGAAPEQITVLNVTGSVTNKAYGCLVSGVDKPEILQFAKLGSPAKFEITDASPFIYKVIGLKEENPNEYLVTATKYTTGKFNLIEKNISIEDKKNTFSYQVAQEVNGITYQTLDAPVIDSLTTGVPNPVTDTFTVTGMWTAIANATGYNVRLTLPNGDIEEATNPNTLTGHAFTGMNQVGVFNWCVNSLGNKGGEANVNAYFDSDYVCSGIFIVYEELFTFSRAFLNQITIL